MGTPEDHDRKFAETFRLARIAAGKSQSDIATEAAGWGLDISQAVVGKIERGERRVTLGEAEVLSAILGESPRGLMRGPGGWRLDRGFEFAREQEARLKEAVERFQSAQVALAMALTQAERDDPNPRGLDGLTRSEVEYELARTPLDVLRDYETDVRARQAAMVIIDNAESEQDEEYNAFELDETTAMRFLRERQETVDSSMGALGMQEAFEAMQVSMPWVDGGADGAAADPTE